MELHLETGNAAYMIRAYQPGLIQVNDQSYMSSLIVSPNQIHVWQPQKFAELNPENIHIILSFSSEVILLGTGKHLQFPAPDLLAELYQHQIGIEIMDTAAACRTYQVLMTEGRHVVAALLVA